MLLHSLKALQFISGYVIPFYLLLANSSDGIFFPYKMAYGKHWGEYQWEIHQDICLEVLRGSF